MVDQNLIVLPIFEWPLPSQPGIESLSRSVETSPLSAQQKSAGAFQGDQAVGTSTMLKSLVSRPASIPNRRSANQSAALLVGIPSVSAN